MEFMIASLILTVSMLAYVSALPTAVQVMHQASSYSEAMAFTQQRVETVRNLSFANIVAIAPPAPPSTATETGSHSTIFTVATTVPEVVGTTPNRYANVLVRTTWTEKGQAKSLSLSFVVAET